MIDDIALERNRRYAWARYYALRNELSETVMRRAELAVFVESLHPPSDHPVWEEVAAALETVSPGDLEHIRRYVRWRLVDGLPSPLVPEVQHA